MDLNKVEEKILFKRRLLVGRTKPTSYDPKPHNVYLETEIKERMRDNKRTVDLKKIRKYKTFSISGYSKNFGGQIVDELNENEMTFNVDPKKVKDIKRIWKQWHLNDLKAGTTAQEKALGRMKKYDYNRAVKKLKKKGLYSDRGYKYGHAWLVKPLPSKVEKKIMRLFK